MKNQILFTLFLLLVNINCNAQATAEIDQQMDWAIHTLDRWLIQKQPVCDVCLDSTKLAQISSTATDSLFFENYYSNVMVNMNDIFDALAIVETLTGIESTLQYNLGTFGITCMDCSTYESDRKKWLDWYNENKLTISPEKIEQLKSIRNKV